jgi:SRSO17 transposase
LLCARVVLSNRSNCQQIADVSDDSNQQRLHHLLSKAKSQASSLMDEVALQFVKQIEQLELQDDLQSIIDESGFAKKGKKSKGVARQYNDSAGKIDNCQVGVFAALNAGSITNLINTKLYTPKSETSKIDHALDLINHTIDTLKLPVKYVSFDAFYGRDSSLLATLKNKKIHFVADVPENHQICLEPLQMRLPKGKGTKGRPHIYKKPTRPFISIQEYAVSLKKKDFSFLAVRHASKGRLKAYFHKRTIYIINPHTKKCMELILLIRKDVDGTLKFSLCHAPQDVTLKELAYQQSKRYFIERNFQDSKQELGLDDYQCQSEIAWERNMSLCMLAMLFINKEKCENLQEVHIYLSSSDIKKTIVAIALYNKTKQQRIFKEILTKTQMTKAKAKKNVYIRI